MIESIKLRSLKSKGLITNFTLISERSDEKVSPFESLFSEILNSDIELIENMKSQADAFGISDIKHEHGIDIEQEPNIGIEDDETHKVSEGETEGYLSGEGVLYYFRLFANIFVLQNLSRQLRAWNTLF